MKEGFRHCDVVGDPVRALQGFRIYQGIVDRLLQALARARATIKARPVVVSDPHQQKKIARLYRDVDPEAMKLFGNDPVKRQFWRDQMQNAEAAARTNGRKFAQRYSDETLVFALALAAKIGKGWQ